MKDSSSLLDRRQLLWVILSAIAAILGVGTSLVKMWQQRKDLLAQGHSSDWPSRNEKDFRALVPYLPNQGEIGYLRDINEEPDLQKSSYYQLAQHALIPLILKPFAEQALVLGNFRSNQELSQAIQGKPFKLIANVAPGLAVFENLTAPTAEDPQAAS